MGAGVAGVILFAGLTFAALSISKRNSSMYLNSSFCDIYSYTIKYFFPSSPNFICKYVLVFAEPEEYMLPLETKQELAYDTADIIDTAEEQKIEGKSVTLDTDSNKFRAYMDQDSSYKETDDGISESKLNPDKGMANSKDVGDITYDNSIQEDLQNELVTDDTPVAPDGTTLPFVASNSGESEGRLAETSKINSELEGTSIDSDSLVSNTRNTNLSTDLQEGVPGSHETEYSKLSTDLPSSSIADIPIAPIDSTMFVNSEIDIGLENQVSGQEDIETIGLQVESEGRNVVNMVEVSTGQVPLDNNVTEGGPPASTLVSPLAYSFANEPNENGFSDMKWSGSFSDSNPGKFSFSTGMPAPSVVFPALQAFPGKVLVPAVVDQVQGQALAALQVLKVTFFLRQLVKSV